ncbi:transglycosylase domain-containing protein [Spongiactinospora sp. TRM90649]|uniref:transglycosylase domain-containing protein n=1 Tax=Spongiactinospora sp. TRM90649 TaxID=3031114 RepID=UPI0023F7F723|nr:transglycosylase domain-containing protein [Spongiactinospora sp. TRM90649]MDF5754301.1 transglycosylase domain-containing protein [Spongiactinospora sp. TRM90649]
MSSSSPRTRLSSIARLATAATAAGLVTAALVLPGVGGSGTAVVAVADALNLRPEALAEPPLPEKTTVYDRDGKRIAQFYAQDRRAVPLESVSEVMRTAIVAIEDYRFYDHGAIDVEGTARAVVKNFASGGIGQGGSSITQQYVKQVLLNSARTDEEKNAAVEASYARKLRELRHAMAVEQKYTKDQILEKYLNIAYFGAGANGVEAAAKRFFGVSAAKLDLAQAATLAGAVQDPNRTSPDRGAKAKRLLLERRNVVLDRMAELGRITRAQAAEAKARKLGYKGVRQPNGCQESRYPYFCEYVRHELLSDPAFGRTRDTRERTFGLGGLQVRTTLDAKAQRAAEAAIKKHVAASDRALAAEALVQPGTGEIRAIAASRPYGSARNHISYNPVADSKHGGLSGFQPGSTYKTFTLITALKQGMRIDDGITAGAGYTASGSAAFRNCAGENVGDPSWTVTNDEGSPGFKTLATGTWGSVNTFFMALQERVGLCETAETARSLGVKRADGAALHEYETFTLGINESDPVTMATAYAAIAARGTYCEPMAITSITGRDGKKTNYRPRCERALDPGVADATAHILSGVFTNGTARGLSIGRPAAGKTGTTDGYATAWFAGFTPDLAGAVAIGDPRGAQRHKLTGVTIGGRYYGAVQGASLPGPIWQATMTAALSGVAATPFTPVDTARFGGCTKDCAPEPRDTEEDRDRDNGNDRGPGNRDDRDNRGDRDNGNNGNGNGNDRRDRDGRGDRGDRGDQGDRDDSPWGRQNLDG